ncbi:hypothetical protein Tco_1129037 [Tanacetum coccineum]
MDLKIVTHEIVFVTLREFLIIKHSFPSNVNSLPGTSLIHKDSQHCCFPVVTSLIHDGLHMLLIPILDRFLSLSKAILISLLRLYPSDSIPTTIVDQDAPSPSNSQTTPETQSLVIPNDVEEDNHDLDVAHMNNNPFFGIPIPKNDSEASSSSDVIPTIVHTAVPNSEHITIDQGSSFRQHHR